MSGHLYTADNQRISLEKNITELTRQEMQMLSWLHEWAFKQQVNIFCKRCEQPITGQNNDDPSTTHVSVGCGCREWRFKRR